eukprot:355305-Chlamydomonas_euryale.AAC.5
MHVPSTLHGCASNLHEFPTTLHGCAGNPAWMCRQPCMDVPATLLEYARNPAWHAAQMTWCNIPPSSPAHPSSPHPSTVLAVPRSPGPPPLLPRFHDCLYSHPRPHKPVPLRLFPLGPSPRLPPPLCARLCRPQGCRSSLSPPSHSPA